MARGDAMRSSRVIRSWVYEVDKSELSAGTRKCHRSLQMMAGMGGVQKSSLLKTKPSVQSPGSRASWALVIISCLHPLASIPTVTSALETLTKLELAKKLTGKRRDRLF